ncbi:MAG TPA: hypothetical protein VJB08_00860 [Candidatus Nanoarchaeia archaeon]|nr:hypothetical protein [Candidatus Nanoarchaeia archaeon]
MREIESPIEGNLGKEAGKEDTQPQGYEPGQDELGDEAHVDEKKENRKLGMIVISLVALFLLFIGVFLYSKSQGPVVPTYTYNGFVVEKVAGLWNTEWQRGDTVYKIHLRYGPREAEDVSLEFADEFVITNTTYITFDPEGEDLGYVALASAEITLSLSNVFGIQAVAACSRNATDACHTRPIVNCEISNGTTESIIFIKEHPEPKVSVQDNCLVIQGRKEEIVRAADKVIWKWYGIIK